MTIEETDIFTIRRSFSALLLIAKHFNVIEKEFNHTKAILGNNLIIFNFIPIMT